VNISFLHLTRADDREWEIGYVKESSRECTMHPSVIMSASKG
jgi:hypothetical protein